jgi:dinuclear metal center YbgI/SA1388 family protein
VPAATTDLLAELDRLLEPTRFSDYSVNGLQVPGPDQVDTIATGVSASAQLFELAAAERAGLLLVHHGLFWTPGVQAIDAVLARRLRLLFDANIALAAYHLPLDAHPELGNNAQLADGLGAEQREPFALHRGQPIGCLATLPGQGESAGHGESADPQQGVPADADPGHGMPADDLFARVRHITAREPLVLGAGPARVRRLAIVSGAGGDYLADAAAAGADALLTGEVPERATTHARELGLHLIAAGHYATETFGVRRLGELLAERFDLRHVFLDVPNPV